MSRREFVRASAGTTLALLAPRVHARSSDEIRVGVVGCGGRGTGAAAQALDADPGAVITAMADVFPDRIETSIKNLSEVAGDRVRVPAERRYGGFDGWRELLDSGVDVVILVTPPHFRPAQLAASIESGKHVFCEKPMAVDSTGVRSIIASAARAKEKNLSLVAGFCWRYSAPERATYARLHDGAIGEIVSMHTTYHAIPLDPHPRELGWSDMEFQLRNWWHFRWLSGDHIVEQACHSIDKINWAMNGVMPVKATALGGRLMREGATSGDVYDHFTVVYEYQNGVRAFHTCRQMDHCSNDNTDYVMGRRGTCYVNGWGPTHVIVGENPWRYDGAPGNMYQTEHDELFTSIRNGTPINDGTWMAQSTMMSILGRMAAYSGQTVTWDDALASSEEWRPPSYAFGPLPVEAVAKPGAYVVPGPPPA